MSTIPSRHSGLLRRAALVATLFLAVSQELSAQDIAPPDIAVQDLAVAMNQARLLKLPAGVATLVIGNPAIADATLQPGSLLVVTGKSFGRTNLIALDSSGSVLMEREVSVIQRDTDVVTVYRGPAGGRQTLDCSPQCEPTVMAGDAPELFDATVKQINDRNSLAGQK